jgi:hypothetical protein
MARIPSLLTVGMLLLSMGSLGANAQPRSPWRDAGPGMAIHRVQYNDGGRCFNSCISGRIFHRCQADAEAERENCCNRVCNRLNNDNYEPY